MQIDSTLSESKTLQFGLKARELRQQGKDIISLGLGEATFDTPEHIKQAATDALAAGLTRYSAAPGLPELRELIAKKLQSDNGISAETNEIVVTPGAKNALFIACAAVLRPGDEVINFNPCYVSNNPILKLAEPTAVVHNVPLKEDFSIDQEKVSSLVNEKTRLIVINYPNNPSGKMISEEDAEFLRQIVRDNDLYLLSDEIYEMITFSDKQHISPASFEDIKEKVITVNGFSKAYAMTGWRIGYVHAKGDIVSLMIKIHQQLNTNTPAFIQKAAVAASTGPQTHIADFVAELKQCKAVYDRLLAENENISGSEPEGGFFGFLDISATGMSSDEFCTALLDDTGVAMIPGISFGKDYDGYCRISLVAGPEIVEEGLKRTIGFINKIVSAK